MAARGRHMCCWLGEGLAEVIPVQAPATSSTVLACRQQELDRPFTGLVVLDAAATGGLLPPGWVERRQPFQNVFENRRFQA